MRAIILAAGKGERLKDVTEYLPKPMIMFDGKPLMEHNIDLCKKAGATEIYINLHHLPEMISNRLGDGSDYGVSIQYSKEDALLGTAGAVKKIARDYWQQGAKQPDPFWVIYGDTVSDYDVELLVKKQKETGASVVIAFHYREDTEHVGVAEFTTDLQIKRFVEKPKPGESDSHWVNVGIYLVKPEILDYIPDGFSDFGRDVFPKLLKKGVKMYGVRETKAVKVFDTIEMYNRSFGK